MSSACLSGVRYSCVPTFPVWGLDPALVEDTTYLAHYGSTEHSFTFMVLHRLVGGGHLEVVTFDPHDEVQSADQLLTDGSMLPFAAQAFLPRDTPGDGLGHLRESIHDLAAVLDDHDANLRALEYAGVQLMAYVADGIRLGAVAVPAPARLTWRFIPIALEASGVETKGAAFRPVRPPLLP